MSDFVLRIRNIPFSFSPCERALQLQQMADSCTPERQRRRKSDRKNDFNGQEERRKRERK